jgi:hypothetical protein
MAHPHHTTDREIQNWVYAQSRFWPEPVWIAHCKIVCGLAAGDVRTHQQARFTPCPVDKRDAIIEAFRHFKMISDP